MAPNADDNDPILHSFIAGTRATEQDAQAAELAFRQNPADLISLARFLGRALSVSRPWRAALSPSLVGDLRWLIATHPDSSLTRAAVVHVHHVDDESYSALRAAWLTAVEAHSSNAAVIRSAARFMRFNEPDRSEELLRRAVDACPADWELATDLADLILQSAVTHARHDPASGSVRPAPQIDRERAEQAIAVLDKVLAKAPDARESSLLLNALVRATAAAENWARAELASRALLECAAKHDLGWMHGNAIYRGHTGLGRAALRRGDIEEAKRQLLLAGATPGSPQLDSFGPNMTLARELLDVDARETVLEFFEACRRFWKMHRDQLDTWKTTVSAGGIPDFGANYVY